MRKHTSFFLFLILAVSFSFRFLEGGACRRRPAGAGARFDYMQARCRFNRVRDRLVQANPNRPLHDGDNLWTDGIRVASCTCSTAIRLSSETGISF